MTKVHQGKIKSSLNQRINLSNIAVGGHSYGGATAIHASKTDKRVKACFVFDGWINPVPKSTIKSGLVKPFLSIGRPSWEKSDYSDNYNFLKKLFSNSSDFSHNLIIKNTLHLDYTDIPMYSPIIKHVMDVGDLPPFETQDLINNLTYTFLETYLLGKPAKNFKKLLENTLIYAI